MKKFVCLLLVLLFLPVVSFASDPIVGSWYMVYDKTLFPELASNFQNCDLILCVYTFFDDGSIFLSENDITDKSGTFSSTVAGKWEKGFSVYTYNIVGFGSGNCYVEGDELLLQVYNMNTYFKFRRMIPYDFYNDYVTR